MLAAAFQENASSDLSDQVPLNIILYTRSQTYRTLQESRDPPIRLAIVNFCNRLPTKWRDGALVIVKIYNYNSVNNNIVDVTEGCCPMLEEGRIDLHSG